MSNSPAESSSAPVTMTGGQALARQLVNEGVEVIFGLPGDQLMAALDALVDTPQIRYIVTRHEQGTTYMADGYARTSGRPGVAMVVPGVGVYNAATGLATAYACSSPVLLLAGQVNRHGIGQDLGLLHDIHDQLDVVRPITKWAQRVLEPHAIPAAVRQAFFEMASGRPRPTEIEIPPETFIESEEVTLLARTTWPRWPPTPSWWIGRPTCWPPRPARWSSPVGAWCSATPPRHCAPWSSSCSPPC